VLPAQIGEAGFIAAVDITGIAGVPLQFAIVVSR
jgi:hypothetical protein